MYYGVRMRPECHRPAHRDLQTPWASELPIRMPTLSRWRLGYSSMKVSAGVVRAIDVIAPIHSPAAVRACPESMTLAQVLVSRFCCNSGV